MPPSATWLLPTLIMSAPETAGDATDRSVIFVISSSILALLVVLLILLQLAAIRRRSFRPGRSTDTDTESGIDPWQESARRISVDESDGDQS